MRLFQQEMRKIWRPGIMAVLILLGALYYFLRPKFWIEVIPRTQNFEMSLLLVEQYGPRLTAEVRPELDAIMEELEDEFDRQVRDIPGAAEAGIMDHASYREQDKANLYNANPELHNQLTQLYMPVNDFGVLTGYCDGMMSGVFDVRNSPRFDQYSPREQARMVELEESFRTGGMSFLNDFVVEYTGDWGRYLSIWTVISVVLLLSPTLVRDRLRRTQSMQWATRRGRRVVRTQIAAAVVSALLLSLVNLAVYAVLLARQGSLPLWDCPIYCINRYPWFDWTYGQYLLILSGMSILFGLAAGALAVFLSQFSANYVPMLLKALPLILALGLGAANFLLSDAFFMRKPHWGAMRNPKGMEFVCIAAFLAAGFGLCLWTWARQKRREL